MNILTVIQRYYPAIGGSENLTKNLIDYLSKNHQISVYSTTAEDIESFWYDNDKTIFKTNPLNYEIQKFDFLTPTQIKHDSSLTGFPFATTHPGPFSPNLWDEIFFKKIDFDLIFITAFPYDHVLAAYAAAKKWNIPIIIMPLIHQEFPELFLSATKLTILNNSDSIVVLSESEKSLLIKYGIIPEKISIIPPTLIPKTIEHSEVLKFKSKIISNLKSEIVLFIGLKSTMKGIFHLIESMKKVWAKRKNVLLILIGPSTHDFDNYYSKLPTKIKNKIIDLGIVNEEDKNYALSICDLFVLPSKGESFGLAYVEAWIHSKPVIGCNLNSVSEIIESQKNGMLTEFGNILDLEQKILFLLDNPSIRTTLGNNGKIKSLEYTSKNNFNKFEKLCNDVIERFNS